MIVELNDNRWVYLSFVEIEMDRKKSNSEMLDFFTNYLNTII